MKITKILFDANYIGRIELSCTVVFFFVALQP